MSFNQQVAHEIDLVVLKLEADLYKALNDYREVFDQFVERYPYVDITASNTSTVQSYYSGLKSISEGMDLLLRAYEELCALKKVAV